MYYKLYYYRLSTHFEEKYFPKGQKTVGLDPDPLTFPETQERYGSGATTRGTRTSIPYWLNVNKYSFII